MSVFSRSNQGGAIATFIIIVVVLTVVTIGGVYFARERGETARREAAIALADAQKAPKPLEETTPPAEDSTPQPTTNQPATPQPAPTTEAAPATPTVNTAQPAALPTTGPTESLLQIGMIIVMVITIARYASSRRQLVRSL